MPDRRVNDRAGRSAGWKEVGCPPEGGREDDAIDVPAGRPGATDAGGRALAGMAARGAGANRVSGAVVKRAWRVRSLTGRH
ncbi:hypothetical protein OH687_26240 [Burkholderia anthina]|nr:hypothetical protein OH687_26240 [Burkholderia anthina]